MINRMDRVKRYGLDLSVDIHGMRRLRRPMSFGTASPSCRPGQGCKSAYCYTWFSFRNGAPGYGPQGA